MDNSSPSPESLILVAVMNQLRDLEIARVLGWYRIPLRSAPKVISIDFLAFYQTSAFGDDRWQIRYIAPVHGHELTTREQLLQDETDHPNSKQEYYKIQLGPLTQLPVPIRAKKWRRITFFYTTGDLFNSAEDIQDLVVPHENRQVLWQALRERAKISEQYHIQGHPALDIDPNLLSELLGIKELEQDYSIDSA